MCRKICFILVVVLLGGLAACYEAPAGGGPGATPSVMSALSPTASATAVPSATATSTATATQTETPTPTPTPEATPALSQEEMEELAGLLTPDNCGFGCRIGPVNKHNSSLIYQVSTGIVERLAITDELGNEVAGVDVLRAVVLNKEGQPVVVKVVVQGWTEDNPNLNAYWWTYRRLFEGAEDEERLPKTVLPLEYIKQMFSKGLVFSTQVELEPLGDSWLGVTPDVDPEILFVNLLLAQTTNTEKMKIFLFSQGVEGADSDFFIATTFLGINSEQLAPLP